MNDNGEIRTASFDKVFYLKLVGDVRLPWCVSLETYCTDAIEKESLKQVVIDLNDAENLDSTTLGVVTKIGLLASKRFDTKPELYYDSEDIERLIMSMGMASVFQLKREQLPFDLHFEVLPWVDCSEDSMKDSVLDAHRTLVDINEEENSPKFDALIKTLSSK